MPGDFFERPDIRKELFGPRDSKPPTSKGYAVQTLYHLRSLLDSERCNERDVFMELDRIEKYEHWKVLGYESMEGMFDEPLGELSERAKRRLQVAHEQFVLDKNGGDRRSRSFQSRNARLKVSKSDTKDYQLARLRRDRPDLAERVELPKSDPRHISAHAAVIEAGWRTVLIQVPKDDAEGIVTALKRRCSAKVLRQVAKLLKP